MNELVPKVLSVLLCCLDKALSKITVSEEEVCLAYRLRSSSRETKQELRQGTWMLGLKQRFGRLSGFSFASLAYSATFLREPRSTCPPHDYVNSGVGPAMSISNQEKASQMCLQGNLMKTILPLKFPFYRHA